MNHNLHTSHISAAKVTVRANIESNCTRRVVGRRADRDPGRPSPLDISSNEALQPLNKQKQELVYMKDLK